MSISEADMKQFLSMSHVQNDIPETPASISTAPGFSNHDSLFISFMRATLAVRSQLTALDIRKPWML
jgi:hypothetical protein